MWYGGVNTLLQLKIWEGPFFDQKCTHTPIKPMCMSLTYPCITKLNGFDSSSLITIKINSEIGSKFGYSLINFLLLSFVAATL